MPGTRPPGTGMSCGRRGMEESLSYPHAVALEDVVAVERRGVQGVGRRLVLDGAGERRGAGTQTLGYLRAGRGGRQRGSAGTKQGHGGVSADRQTDRADNAGESGFCTRSSFCPHARPCSRNGTFLPTQLFLTLSVGLRPPALLPGPLPSPKRAPKIVALEGFTLMLQGPALVLAEGVTCAPSGQPNSAQVTPESSEPPLLPAVRANRPVPSVQTPLPWGESLSASSRGADKTRGGQGRAGLSPERCGVLLARRREALGGSVGHLGAPKAMSPRGLELRAGFSGVDPLAQVPAGCFGRATLPGTAAWEPGGCSGVVACTWVCWAAGSGGGRNVWWVEDQGGPTSAAPIGGSRRGDEPACAACTGAALSSPSEVAPGRTAAP